MTRKDRKTGRNSAETLKANGTAKSPRRSSIQPPARPPRKTKTQTLIALLKRKNGATLGDLQQASRWQTHSVRGFLSGTVKKKLGLDLISKRNAKGQRRYRISKQARRST